MGAAAKSIAIVRCREFAHRVIGSHHPSNPGSLGSSRSRGHILHRAIQDLLKNAPLLSVQDKVTSGCQFGIGSGNPDIKQKLADLHLAGLAASCNNCLTGGVVRAAMRFVFVR
jgi:hypothetical protein